MRKVVAYELLSLDGVAEDPAGYITEFDDVMKVKLGRVIADQDVVLLGRRTWDDWAAFWSTSTIEPFASFINSVQKYVVTSTSPIPEWGNTTVVEGGPAEFVSALKHEPGGDIGVHGSITLTQTLLAEELIDELRLVIAPALMMHGRRLFEKAAGYSMSLLRSVISPTGSLLLDYQFGS